MLVGQRDKVPPNFSDRQRLYKYATSKTLHQIIVDPMDESLASLYARADVLRREIDEGGADQLQVMFYAPKTCV